MKSSVQTGYHHGKRLPDDNPDQYVNKRAESKLENNRKIDVSHQRSHSRDRSTLLMAGQSHFTE